MEEEAALLSSEETSSLFFLPFFFMPHLLTVSCAHTSEQTPYATDSGRCKAQDGYGPPCPRRSSQTLLDHILMSNSNSEWRHFLEEDDSFNSRLAPGT